MAFHQIWDKNYEDNTVITLILQKWLDQSPMSEENLTGKSASLAFWAYLPEPVRWSWTTGKYFSPNFRYGLDEEREKQVLEIIENYGRRFLVVEKELDAIAANGPAE